MLGSLAGIRDQAPLGAFTDIVTVHTTSRRTPALPFPVVGVVEDDA